MPKLLASFVLAACAMATVASPAFAQKRFDGVTLRVGTYGGTWRDNVHEQVGKKLEALGAKVEYVLGNPADNLAKLIASRGQSPIDVMEIGPAERVAMVKHDFLTDIPMQHVPNAAKLPKGIVEPKLVPHIIVQNGIVYRADKFQEAGIGAPTRYSDLINPKLAGKIAFPDVTNTQHWTAVTGMAYDVGSSESAPGAGFKQVVQSKPLYFFSAASELAQKFSLGDVIAAPWHSGWAVRLTRSGQNIGFTNPIVNGKKGAIEYNYLGIPKGAKNVEAAAYFINAFIDAQAQADFTKIAGVVPVSPDARKQLATDPVLAKFMFLNDNDIEGAYVVNFDKINQEQWRADWVRAISAK